MLAIFPLAAHAALKMDNETLRGECFLVVHNVEPLGYNLEHITAVPNVEVGHSKLSIDGKGRGSVLEVTIIRPFETQQAIGKDGEAVLVASDDS